MPKVAPLSLVSVPQITKKGESIMSEHAQNIPEKKRPKRKKRILRRMLAMLLVLVVIAGAGYYAYSSLKQEYTVSYTGYTASIGSISNALSFSGSLNLIDSQTYSAEKAGTVRTIYVQPGDDVAEGDKLMRLDNGETIKAEFNGRVNSIKVAEGDEVTAGTSLIQVADFTHMKVSIRVDEYDIADVSVGQTCTVTATATEKTFESSIDAIDYISASAGNVAYYTATAYVDVDEGVYPGMQVTVTIPQEEAENVVVLKMDALSFDESNSAYVYMYNDSGVLEEVPVEVGVSNGNYVEIKSGLQSGDEVYVETEVETASSGLGSLMSGLFGGQQMTPPTGAGGMGNMPGGAGGSGMGNMPGGGMPGSNDRNAPSGGGMPGGNGGGMP